MKVVRVVILFFFLISVVSAQSNHSRSGGSQGSLRVTVTVVPSVWLNMDSNGKQEVVVANSSADPKDSFSHAAQRQKQTVVPARSKKRSAATKKTSTGTPQAAQGGNQSEAAGQFNVPKDKQFEVKEEVIMMDVTQNGKTERQPVKVTTVVLR